MKEHFTVYRADVKSISYYVCYTPSTTAVPRKTFAAMFAVTMTVTIVTPAVRVADLRVLALLRSPTRCHRRRT